MHQGNFAQLRPNNSYQIKISSNFKVELLWSRYTVKMLQIRKTEALSKNSCWCFIHSIMPYRVLNSKSKVSVNADKICLQVYIQMNECLTRIRKKHAPTGPNSASCKRITLTHFVYLEFSNALIVYKIQREDPKTPIFHSLG